MQRHTFFHDTIAPPDILLVQGDSGWAPARRENGNVWRSGDALATAEPAGGGLKITLSAGKTPLMRVALLWRAETPPGARILCDSWERGYGDLEWRGIVPERVLPWFFLMHDCGRTHGCGVMTGPAAMCFWQVDERWVTLCLDVRCGGVGVELDGRELELATVVTREGVEGEAPFRAAQAFCRAMCPNPVLPAQPVYGGNNWYYAYGKSSHGEILEDAAFISGLSPDAANRPFMVIDEGWGLARSARAASLWRSGNERFPNMPRLAEGIRERGAKPGIWVRPLAAPDGTHEALCLPPGRMKHMSPGKFLDPSVPEALQAVRDDFAELALWGYGLIKCDYSTVDLLGRWGFDMHHELTNDGWSFFNRGRTTAEIIQGLYRAMRGAADGALIIGCNTVGHIAAGLFEIQRTGDDTSGRQWERTRKMGVNTLAFAMPKHGALYASDADCAGITPDIPWALNRQWLDLLAHSGTPLFVSASPAAGPEQARAMREAFAVAAKPVESAEPLDWMGTTCPARWRAGGGETIYRWHREDCLDFTI